MDGTDQAPEESKEDCHYIVQSDDANANDRTDIGWITVRPESRFEHWVKLPDGQFRKRYKSREIDQADVDLLYAFEAMPRLTVSYRPVAKFLKDTEGLFYFITILILLLYVFCGWVIMVANWFGLAGAIIHSNAAYYISATLVIALPVSVVVTYLSNRSQHTWKHLTPDDFAADKKAEATRQMKKRMAAEIAAQHH